MSSELRSAYTSFEERPHLLHSIIEEILVFKQFPVKRLAMMLAIIYAAVANAGTSVQAFTNPFSLGSIDELSCTSGSPILTLSIKNNDGVPVALESYQWTKPILYVAYFEADGVTEFPVAQVPIPNIAGKHEEMLEVPVQRADTTFTVAIHATDPSGNTVKLLTGTRITPSDHCPLPSKLMTPIVSQNPIVQQATATVNAAMLAYVNTTPTNVTFPKSSVCFKHPGTQTCVYNPGSGLLVAWNYNNPKAPGVGFRVYRVDNGLHKYMTSVSANLNATAAILPAPKTGDFAGQCFAVVAVRNSLETNLSPSKCATTHDSLHQTRISALNLLAFEVSGGHEHGTRDRSRVASVAVPFVQPGTTFLPSVGYAYDTDPQTIGPDNNQNMIMRLAVFFDPLVYGVTIQKATFTLIASNSLVNYTPQAGNCAKEFAPAKDDNWVTHFPNQEPPSLDALDPGTFQPFKQVVPTSGGVAAGADVTAIVQGWATTQSTNHGFIVRNPDENVNGYNAGLSCLSLEKNAYLDIQYF